MLVLPCATDQPHYSTAASATTTTTTTTPAGLTEDDVARALMEVTSFAQRTPSLEEVVTSQAVLSLMDDDAVVEALLALLPEGRRTREELVHTASSPHLGSALRALSRALNSSPENLATIIATFQLKFSAASGDALLARGDGLGAFLAALEEAVEEEERKRGGENQDSSSAPR